MTDLLREWISEYRPYLEQSGFKLEWKSGYLSDSSSVNVDSSAIVGNITFWPADRFEFQINSCADGSELLLEEHKISSVSDLHEQFLNIQKKVLKKL